ncbi:hypothetical protein M409DRAFT_52573 [Zasmidium cellare ATCC 36951]|uniref:Uncharacterized protein n=1 Tax=Zasmidium cellare ATCC 36951 TaxID=1080233 RepID=A0A6A6CQH7_ZASCE|nr:uncharacterized protein M409DRAFT_52573 [Zasmidium cellare ATCC 36951]KAF2169321.1 hypothetical protein M409DRAFT_52573 [Zasmidium cellare ATCC 36951]
MPLTGIESRRMQHLGAGNDGVGAMTREPLIGDMAQWASVEPVSSLTGSARRGRNKTSSSAQLSAAPSSRQITHLQPASTEPPPPFSRVHRSLHRAYAFVMSREYQTLRPESQSYRSHDECCKDRLRAGRLRFVTGPLVTRSTMSRDAHPDEPAPFQSSLTFAPEIISHRGTAQRPPHCRTHTSSTPRRRPVTRPPPRRLACQRAASVTRMSTAATAMDLAAAPSPHVLFPQAVQHDRDAPGATRAATVRLIGFTLAHIPASWLPACRAPLIRAPPETSAVPGMRCGRFLPASLQDVIARRNAGHREERPSIWWAASRAARSAYIRCSPASVARAGPDTAAAGCLGSKHTSTDPARPHRICERSRGAISHNEMHVAPQRPKDGCRSRLMLHGDNAQTPAKRPPMRPFINQSISQSIKTSSRLLVALPSPSDPPSACARQPVDTSIGDAGCERRVELERDQLLPCRCALALVTGPLGLHEFHCAGRIGLAGLAVSTSFGKLDRSITRRCCTT